MNQKTFDKVREIIYKKKISTYWKGLFLRIFSKQAFWDIGRAELFGQKLEPKTSQNEQSLGLDTTLINRYLIIKLSEFYKIAVYATSGWKLQGYTKFQKISNIKSIM